MIYSSHIWPVTAYAVDKSVPITDPKRYVVSACFIVVNWYQYTTLIFYRSGRNVAFSEQHLCLTLMNKVNPNTEVKQLLSLSLSESTTLDYHFFDILSP